MLKNLTPIGYADRSFFMEDFPHLWIS